MTNSKAPWLTRGGAIALMAAAGIALAACSGGGGLNEDEAAGLQQELEDAKADAAAALTAQQLEEAARIAAEAAQALAEAEKLKAETEKVAAETARDAAVALAEAAEKSAAAAAASAQDAADALVEALAAQVEAEAKQAEAEAARDDAEAAADEADRLRLAAERAEAAEERLRRDAETARERAEEETEEARQEVNRVDARVAHVGLVDSVGTAAGTVDPATVKARYRGMTMLTTSTALTLRQSTAPSIGSPWSGTTLSSTTSTGEDELVVYTNIGPATRVSIETKHMGFTDTDGDDNRAIFGKDITTDVDGATYVGAAGLQAKAIQRHTKQQTTTIPRTIPTWRT